MTETNRTEPAYVSVLAASVGADAVLLDVVEPVALDVLVNGLGAHTLLRPLLEYVRTSRGELQPVFVGYGRISEGGTVELLPDASLRLAR